MTRSELAGLVRLLAAGLVTGLAIGVVGSAFRWLLGLAKRRAIVSSPKRTPASGRAFWRSRRRWRYAP